MWHCIFSHSWNGCKCRRCGCRRDKKHAWDGCRCVQCNTTRDAEHLWYGCCCSRCNKTRAEAHVWEGCRCKQCKKVRSHEDPGHQKVGCHCRECNLTWHKWKVQTVWDETCPACLGAGQINTEDFGGSIGRWIECAPTVRRVKMMCLACGTEEVDPIMWVWEKAHVVQ
jgi:hypothetical protein